MRLYETEIAKVPSYNNKLTQLSATGSDVLSEPTQLERIVRTEASAAGLQISGTDPRTKGNARTNQFFEDQILTMNTTSTDKELVDFLVRIANGNSMIRVREMTLRPDPPQFRLIGNLVLVASYQKKQPAAVKVAATAQPAQTPANLPAPLKTSTNKPAAPTAATNGVPVPALQPKLKT